MRNQILLFSILLVSSSCATKRQEQFPQAPNAQAWIGRDKDEILTHTIFATMPMETRKTSKGVEVFTFKNEGSTISASNCYGNKWGAGCSGESVHIVCSHVFTATKEKITNYVRVGACGEESLRFRPQNIDGTPMLTSAEQSFIERNVASEGEVQCKSTSECSEGRSCSIPEGKSSGQCKHLGLWGRVFNP